ncbi:MAG: universal stress protein [Chloroflexota bacterium]
MDRILLGFDGSNAAWDALDKAAHLAKLSGAAVGIVHVAPVERANHLTEPLRAAQEALHVRGIEASTFAVFGDPVEEIRRLALDGEFDTIVLGSRPRGALRRLVDGSIALRLASDAPVTVIIARSG